MGTARTPLSRTSVYALRAMVHLARNTNGTRVRARDLAVETSVPRPYLSKILARMVAAGVLTSEKGHGGGFALAREPDRIRFSEILSAVEPDLVEDECAFGWESCDEENPCPLHPAWSQLKEAISEWASRQTLAEFLDADF